MQFFPSVEGILESVDVVHRISRLHFLGVMREGDPLQWGKTGLARRVSLIRIFTREHFRQALSSRDGLLSLPELSDLAPNCADGPIVPVGAMEMHGPQDI